MICTRALRQTVCRDQESNHNFLSCCLPPILKENVSPPTVETSWSGPMQWKNSIKKFTKCIFTLYMHTLISHNSKVTSDHKYHSGVAQGTWLGLQNPQIPTTLSCHGMWWNHEQIIDPTPQLSSLKRIHFQYSATRHQIPCPCPDAFSWDDMNQYNIKCVVLILWLMWVYWKQKVKIIPI